MTTPTAAMPAMRAATLAAVANTYATQGRVTIRAVADQLGGVSTHLVWLHLRALRAMGLVGFEDGGKGTLRPTFVVYDYRNIGLLTRARLDRSKADVYR